MKSYFYFGLVAVALFFCAGFLFLTYRAELCLAVPPQEPAISSHGWRVWTGENFMSFDQNGEHFCIPEGFEPVGEIEKNSISTVFPSDGSGVFVRSADFEFTDIAISDTPFKIRVVHLKGMSKESVNTYTRIITRAFIDVNSLYPKYTGKFVPHTVLITVGVAGDGNDFDTAVYPDPSERMSIIVRPYDHKRGEELYIHAVAHLYNRYNTFLTAYETAQYPIAKDEWQELEASWSEIAFRSSNEGRIRRLNEMYDIYTAVYTNTFSDSLLYPFNDRELFNSITQKTLLLHPDSSYIDYQYGHYMLAPLTLMATETLLQKNGSDTDIKTLFTQIHSRIGENFFVLLKEELSDDDFALVKSWMSGEKMIPKDLVFSAMEYYSDMPTTE